MNNLIEQATRALYLKLSSEGGHVSARGFHDGDTCLDGNWNLEDLVRTVITSMRDHNTADP